MRVTMLPIHRTCFCMLLLLLATPALADEAADQTHYNRCLSNARRNAAVALADAQAWSRAGGGTPAGHCAAVAQIGLGRYGDGAAALDTLAKGKGVPDSALRADLFDQAGNAWILAGNGAKAVASLQAALVLAGGNAEVYVDLARAQALQRDWKSVASDMDAALAIDPRRPDMLVLRASARRALKQYGPARADVEAALLLKPGNADALLERGLLKRQVGDLGGARSDFTAAVKAGGAVGDEARRSLESLGG